MIILIQYKFKLLKDYKNIKYYFGNTYVEDIFWYVHSKFLNL